MPAETDIANVSDHDLLVKMSVHVNYMREWMDKADIRFAGLDTKVGTLKTAVDEDRGRRRLKASALGLISGSIGGIVAFLAEKLSH